MADWANQARIREQGARSLVALEPSLDHVSLAVLAAIPPCGEGNPYRRREADEIASLWQIGEAVDSTDLADVLLTLYGLVQLDYAMEGMSVSRKRQVWWRLPKGDAVLKAG